MKRQVIILLLMAVVTACSNFIIENSTQEKEQDEQITETPEPSEPSEPEIATLESSLYAKVVYGNVDTVKLVWYDRDAKVYIELARGEWKGDGFTMELPETLDPKYLHPLIGDTGLPPSIPDAPSTLAITNKNVNVANVSFIGVHAKSPLRTSFYLHEIDEQGNYSPGGLTYITYVDADVSIFGYREDEVLDYLCGYNMLLDDTPIAPVLWKETRLYSIKWAKGFNVWRFTGWKNCQERTSQEEWTTIPMSRLRWRAQP